MRKHWAALAATTTLLCLLAAPPALGHGGSANFRSEIDSVHPSVPGVSLEVLNYDADMELVDRGGHEVGPGGTAGMEDGRRLGNPALARPPDARHG